MIFLLFFLLFFQVSDLEEIHKKVLCSQDSATREATAVRRALTAVYQVIRDLTCNFNSTSFFKVAWQQSGDKRQGDCADRHLPRQQCEKAGAAAAE